MPVYRRKGQGGVNVSNTTYRGNWSAAVNYVINDVVTHNGLTYVATAASLNQNPTTQTAFWQPFVSNGVTGVMVGATSVASGAAGDVPAAPAGSQNNTLTAAGTFTGPSRSYVIAMSVALG